jgi:hypothetical protein
MKSTIAVMLRLFAVALKPCEKEKKEQGATAKEHEKQVNRESSRVA